MWNFARKRLMPVYLSLVLCLFLTLSFSDCAEVDVVCRICHLILAMYDWNCHFICFFLVLVWISLDDLLSCEIVLLYVFAVFLQFDSSGFLFLLSLLAYYISVNNDYYQKCHMLFLFYRSKRFEQDLQTNRWKITFEDVTFIYRTQSHASKVRTWSVVYS